MESNIIKVIDSPLALGAPPTFFNRISDFIIKIAESYGVLRIVNYLDDFIIIAETEEESLHQRHVLIEVMEYLGFQVSYSKVTEPKRVTTFLGITIDSTKMELSLPQAKVDKLKEVVQDCVGRRYVSKKTIQKIGGLMSFVHRSSGEVVHLVGGCLTFVQRPVVKVSSV